MSKTTTKKAPAAKKPAEPSPFTADKRLPAPGTTIKVTHKGKDYATKFLGAEGFEFGGKRYRSLSAIASEIRGVETNGYLWWGLIGGTKRERASASRAKPAGKSEAKAAGGAKAKKPLSDFAKRDYGNDLMDEAGQRKALIEAGIVKAPAHRARAPRQTARKPQ